MGRRVFGILAAVSLALLVFLIVTEVAATVSFQRFLKGRGMVSNDGSFFLEQFGRSRLELPGVPEWLYPPAWVCWIITAILPTWWVCTRARKRTRGFEVLAAKGAEREQGSGTWR